MDFKTDKYKDGNPKFINWLIQQSERNDIIGDVAFDTKVTIEKGFLSMSANYEDIWKYISDNYESHNFFHQHTESDTELKKKQLDLENEIGHKLREDFTITISPLMCLQFAWDEYETLIVRKKIVTKIRTENNRIGYVYFIGLKESDNLVKIGYSSDTNFIRRQKRIETSSPHDTFLIGFIKSENYISLEKELHVKYNELRKRREWFEIPYEKVKTIIIENKGSVANS